MRTGVIVQRNLRSISSIRKNSSLFQFTHSRAAQGQFIKVPESHNKVFPFNPNVRRQTLTQFKLIHCRLFRIDTVLFILFFVWNFRNAIFIATGSILRKWYSSMTCKMEKIFSSLYVYMEHIFLGLECFIKPVNDVLLLNGCTSKTTLIILMLLELHKKKRLILFHRHSKNILTINILIGEIL